MVVIHMKRSEEQQFLFETTVEATVADTIKELVKIHNLRNRVARLKLEGEELAKYGPAKPPDKEGIDEIQEKYENLQIDKGEHYCADPTGRRTGNAPDPRAAETLVRTLREAEEVASKKQVEKKVKMTAAMLEDAIDVVRGAVMICFPMGIPEWDLVRCTLEDAEELDGTAYSAEVMDDGSQLWWAGKQMMPENKLSAHLGKNEKTKVVAKLQKKGGGAPAREAPISADEQKAMMQWYHKKQEEQKKLVENEEDDYTNSSWANSNSLKQHFSGVGNVRIR